jgi:hypothetical protein
MAAKIVILTYGFGGTVINQHYGKIVFPVEKPLIRKNC